MSTKAQVTSESLAMIPTEWKTELHVYEFKGKIDDLEFLVYINVETGNEVNTIEEKKELCLTN